MCLSVPRAAKFPFQILILGALLSCGGGGDSTAPPTPVPTSVTVSQASGALDAIGATLQAVATVQDQNGNAMPDVAVSWSTSAAGVAQVSSSGIITAIANGSASIIATAGGKSGTLNVTVSQIATTIQKLGGDNQTGTVGTQLTTPLQISATDRLGNPVIGKTVTFTSPTGGSASSSPITTNSSGTASASWTLSTNASTHQVTATIAPGTAQANFTATSTASIASILSVNNGNNQSTPVGTAVPTSPSVRVTDAFNNPISNVQVTFAVGSGGGTSTVNTQTTNSSGIAAVGTWTLGTAGTNTLTATSSGLTGSPLTFTATANAVSSSGPFNIELRFLTSVTAAQSTAFANAATRWQNIITDDITDIAINFAAGSCGSNAPAINQTVDDLIIFVTVDSIDGPNNILGSAGPCWIRSAFSSSPRLPFLGLIRLDSADLSTMQANGTLTDVILHEMGHVLGIGTLWDNFGLLENPSFPSNFGTDTRHIGINTRAGFDLIGGANYTSGVKVPVENTGGQGTQDAHWRESKLVNELMTGFISTSSNPLSLLTIRSLQDFGYVVNAAAADPFNPTILLQSQGARLSSGIHLKNDVFDEPIRSAP